MSKIQIRKAVSPKVCWDHKLTTTLYKELRPPLQEQLKGYTLVLHCLQAASTLSANFGPEPPKAIANMMQTETYPYYGQELGLCF